MAAGIRKVLGNARVAGILGVHPRTLERRALKTRPKNPLQAQREEKLDRVWQELLKVYKPETAERWLDSEVPALGGRRPIDVMAEDGGLDRVLETVGRMTWGIPE